MIKFVTAIVVLGLLPALAYAQSDDGGLLGGLLGGLFGGGSRHGAPAPLLSAGIPAFIALGAGAFASRALRKKHGPGSPAAATDDADQT